MVIVGRLCGAETEKRGRRRRAVVFYSLLCRGPWGRLPGENHGVEVRNDDYYEPETTGTNFILSC